MDSVGESEGGMIWENGIETCIISYVKRIASPGSMQETLRHEFNPWVGKISWRRAWQPTPVFLPGESYGLRRLVGYSPWGRGESDMTEATEHACTFTIN